MNDARLWLCRSYLSIAIRGKVKKAVEGLEYKTGFTNMAQALSLAEQQFLLGGRKKAMSVVITFTDGRPSFLFQTYEKVLQLQDKHASRSARLSRSFRARSAHS